MSTTLQIVLFTNSTQSIEVQKTAIDWLGMKWTACPRRKERKHLNTFPLPVRLGVRYYFYLYE